jgi:hypothetical protein
MSVLKIEVIGSFNPLINPIRLFSVTCQNIAICTDIAGRTSNLTRFILIEGTFFLTVVEEADTSVSYSANIRRKKRMGLIVTSEMMYLITYS